MRNQTVPPEFEALLEYIRQNRGFDFGSYKRASLMRRFRKRMGLIGIEGFTEYQDYLEVHPDEFTLLFNTILINVTQFFRDGELWQYLINDILPRVLEAKTVDEPIRFWSAGCATGQEAYSLAMACAEVIGPRAFQNRVKIYATDLDESALAYARNACYTARQMEGVSSDLIAKYFEQRNGSYCFDRELRRNVIFGRHDLLTDAPISRVDILTCRNTLMYFNAEAQSRIISRFHFALNDTGYLLLGKAESLVAHNALFYPVDMKRRVFSRVPRSHPDRHHLLPGAANPANGSGVIVNHVRLRDAAFDSGELPQFVVDALGNLTLINQKARRLFGLTAADIGRPLRDLELSYRPIELRSLIDRANAERDSVTLKGVEWQSTGADTQHFNVTITPLLDLTGALIGESITFMEITQQRNLERELEHYNQELETAYEELQSANEELQTTNEELQSTVEELETTNEELQSSNEELETMNEELQSTNEELESINEEVARGTDEINRVNLLLTSILASLRDGVIVIDPEMMVIAWNRPSEEMWGVREDEARNRHMLNLDIGLPLEQIRPLIRRILSGESEEEEATVLCVNRRGKAITCQVLCTKLELPSGEAAGVILRVQEIQPDRSRGG